MGVSILLERTAAMLRRSFTLGLAAVVLLAGCVGVTEVDDTDPAHQLAVEVDVFSGRENPLVFLSRNATEGIEAELEGLEFEFGTANPPTLGFRGLLLTRDADTEYRVIRGVVIEESRGEPTGRVAHSSVFDDILTDLEEQDLLEESVLEEIKQS